MKRIVLCFLAAAAHAQFFPSRPIRVVCPFPPGAGGNIAAASCARWAPIVKASGARID